MKGKLIAGLATMVVIPITIGMAAIVNSLQTLIEIPLWLSSLVGTILLAAGTMAYAVKSEENDRRNKYIDDWGYRSHLRQCKDCENRKYHDYKPFKPQVGRPPNA